MSRPSPLIFQGMGFELVKLCRNHTGQKLDPTEKIFLIHACIYMLSFSGKEELPMTQVGFLSQMTYSWQTSMMWNIYRKGIDCIAHMGVGDREKAKPNADR